VPVIICLLFAGVIFAIPIGIKLFIDLDFFQDKPRMKRGFFYAPIFLLVAAGYFATVYVAAVGSTYAIASESGQAVVLACKDARAYVQGPCAKEMTWDQVQQLGCSLSCTGSSIRSVAAGGSAILQIIAYFLIFSGG